MSINKINLPISKVVLDRTKLDEVETNVPQDNDSAQADGLDIYTDTLNKIADFAESKPTDFINRLSYEDLQQSLSDLSPEELKALLSKLNPAELKQLLASLSPENLKALLSQLDPATLKNLLVSLNRDDLKAILEQLNPAEIVLDNLSLEDLKGLINQLDPAELKKVLASLSSENVKAIITLDHAQLTTALGQLKYQDLRALLGHLPPSLLRDAFNRLDETQFLDILTSSKELCDSFAEQCDLNSEHLQQLMDEVKNTCTPEQQEVLDGLLACQTEDEALNFTEEHEHVFMGAPGAEAEYNSVYNAPTAPRLGSGLKANNYLSNLGNFSQGKGDITKLMIFLFMDLYEVRSDVLRRNAASLNAIKDNTKELNSWWDAVRGVGALSDADLKAAGFTPPVNPEDIFKQYDNFGTTDDPTKTAAQQKVKDAYKPLMDKIKNTDAFSDFLAKNDDGTIKEPRTFNFDDTNTPGKLLDTVNSYLGDLCHNLECQGTTSLFDKDSNGYKLPSSWGDKAKDFQQRAAEANTIQQNAATLLNAESTNLQSLNNMQTKMMETRQAILQKITSM